MKDKSSQVIEHLTTDMIKINLSLLHRKGFLIYQITWSTFFNVISHLVPILLIYYVNYI